MTNTMPSVSRTNCDAVTISLPLVPLLLNMPRYSLPATGRQEMKKTTRTYTTKAEAEKERLRLIRQATSDAESRTNIGGNPKTRGSRRKPVTLSDPEWVRKMLDREG